MSSAAIARLPHITGSPDLAGSVDAADRQLTAHERGALMASVAICLLGALLSEKIVGRLALSNLAQVVGLLTLLVGVPKLLRGADIAVWLATAIGVLAASFSVSAQYGYVIQVTYSLFYGLALLWLLAVWRAVRIAGGKEAVADALRMTIPIALAYLVLRGGLEFARGQTASAFGMDDKSHASVYACVLAFAALRFLKGRWRLIAGIALFAISLLTISRLPYLFAPGFIGAFLVGYRSVRRGARTVLGVFFCHLLLLGALLVPFVAARSFSGFFVSFVRAFKAGDAEHESTHAHVLLLDYAFHLKVDSIWNFILGVTPGGFSGTLVRSGIDLSEFSATDPHGYESMILGTAPIHSSTVTILLEFPIWVFVAFVVLALWGSYRLWVNKEFILLLMWASLLLATSFYSSVTELYFMVALAIVIAGGAPPLRPGDSGTVTLVSNGQRASGIATSPRGSLGTG